MRLFKNIVFVCIFVPCFIVLIPVIALGFVCQMIKVAFAFGCGLVPAIFED